MKTRQSAPIDHKTVFKQQDRHVVFQVGRNPRGIADVIIKTERINMANSSRFPFVGTVPARRERRTENEVIGIMPANDGNRSRIVATASLGNERTSIIMERIGKIERRREEMIASESAGRRIRRERKEACELSRGRIGMTLQKLIDESCLGR